MNEENKNKLPFEVTGNSAIKTADQDPSFMPENKPEASKPKEESALSILNEIRTKLNGLDELKNHLESQLKDMQEENKAHSGQFTKLYNSLSQKADKISDRLSDEFNYRDNLQAQIEKRKAEIDSLELKQALADAHANIDASVETVKRDLKIGLDKINKQEDGFAEILKSHLKEMKGIDGIVDEKLNEFRKDMTAANDREYKNLGSRCEAYLKECNNRISEIKEHSLNFLNQCQKQNEAIIEKIPEQKAKFNKKDLIVYVIAGLCTVSLIIQIIMSFR